ncbi:unnamed protein product, partial [Allacma fusca]
MYWSE